MVKAFSYLNMHSQPGSYHTGLSFRAMSDDMAALLHGQKRFAFEPFITIEAALHCLSIILVCEHPRVHGIIHPSPAAYLYLAIIVPLDGANGRTDIRPGRHAAGFQKDNTPMPERSPARVRFRGVRRR